jgi:glyoxylase I family protein
VPPVHHLAIQCRDLPACERFYREVLGLPLLRRWPREGGGDRAVWLGLGDGAFLALERAEGATGHPSGAAAAPATPPWRDGRPGFHLLALAIAADERAGWEARLAAAGAPVVHRTRWTSYVLDPEGNRIGLSHHPEDPA